MQERVHMSWGERFILHPQELVLASTLEYIVLPDNVAAQVLTRSSYGRLGLLTATAVQVQPGSRGCITLELVNQGETPIELSPAARVAQLMLWVVTEPCVVRKGRYWFPVGPEFSKVSDDSDRGPLQALASAAQEPAARTRPNVRARFDGARAAADRFYDVARSLGADDAVAPPIRDRAESTPSFDAGGSGFIVGVVLSIKVLAMVIHRWTQGNAHGVVVTEDDGAIVIRSEVSLSKGSVVVRDKEGVTIKQLVLPPDDVLDIADAIHGLLQ